MSGVKPLFILLSSAWLLTNHCHGAARTITVKLSSQLQQKVGQLGQPVISYWTPISIGTPPQAFNVQFDIGFNDMYVPHYSWNPFNTNLHYRNGFKCTPSSTCTKGQRDLTINYQGCNLTGKVDRDKISFNNANLNENSTLTAYTTFYQEFLAASDASNGRFKDLPFDGTLGLSPTPRSLGDNILISMKNAGLIDNLQFSLWFNTNLDSRVGGELTLGGVDEARYEGKVFWHQVSNSNNLWILNLQSVILNNVAVGCFAGPCQAVLASGVNEVYGPQASVHRIYTLLNTSRQPSVNLELIDCRRIPSLPDLTFTIDGIPYKLMPTNYIRKTIVGTIFKSETCYVAIFASYESNQWIMGTNFLGAYYSTYDLTYHQVGFATLRSII